MPNTATLITNETSQLANTMKKRKSASHFDTTPSQPLRGNSNQAKIAFTPGFDSNSATKSGTGTDGVKGLTSVDIVQLTKYEEAVLNSPKQSTHNTRNWRNGN